jgi:hypothetical protein
MKSLIMAALLAGYVPLVACTKDYDNSTVKEFDLERYLGEWYEIARYDHSFERGMDNTMAQYILQDDGKVVVLNTGWKDGKFKLAECKRIVSTEDDHSGDHNTEKGEEKDLSEGFEEMKSHTSGISLFTGHCKESHEEIDRNEKAGHVTDVEI